MILHKLNIKRKNNPPIGLVSNKTEPLKAEKRKYAFDEHLSPELKFDPQRVKKIEKIIDQGLSGSGEDAKVALEKLKKKQEPYLNWAGKAERTSFEIPTVSLHTHEKIDSRAIVEKVRKTNSVNYEQLSLFKKEQTIPENEAIDFYQHDKNWSNRLIAGDSLLVMNSLLEKEGMAGKIQCIYIDPPYGKNYGSNFQPFTHKKNVNKSKDNDEDLTSEPEMIRAFRDTWKLGIHSYLTYIRDRLLLARELLIDSGSCFVQISDENVHLIRNLMDEVFGNKNFISLISYSSTSGFGNDNFLSRIGDYIIWFAKDKDNVKYHKLYKAKEFGGEGSSAYKNIELADGSRMSMAQWKKNKKESLIIKNMPVGAKVFAIGDLTSSDPPKEPQPFTFQGKTYYPKKGNHWKANYPHGMEKLKNENRIEITKNYIGYVRYFEDFPMMRINNIWTDTLGQNQYGSEGKKYVVQTGLTIVRRCILMTTDPGDIVFDPTCGSGTTAYVAEKWGRRWITCDTSRVAITLAKKRLMTSTFDYYKLKNQDEGISSGFQYKTVPHITLGSIANNEPPKEEVLYDQPLKDNKKARVTGPFTVEAVPSQVVQAIGQEKKTSFKYEWLDEVRKSGIRGKKGIATDMSFVRLEKLSGFKYLHAEGETKNPRSVIISFGPEHSPLDKRQVELALKEIEEKKEKLDVLVFASFHFDLEASRLINEYRSKNTRAVQIQMNMDLQTADLKKKISNDSFWLIGSPDVEIKNSPGKNKDEYVVEVHGWDYYNPSSGAIESGGKSKIALWVLDTDYDGRAVFPRQVFFPMSGKNDGWAKLAKSLKSEIDENLIEKYRGTESLAFKKGKNKKIAVKIIDDRGIESLKIFDFPKKNINKIKIA